MKSDLGTSDGLTSVTGVHVCNKLGVMRVQVRNHIGVAHHVVTRGNAKVGHSKQRSCCTGSGLEQG